MSGAAVARFVAVRAQIGLMADEGVAHQAASSQPADHSPAADTRTLARNRIPMPWGLTTRQMGARFAHTPPREQRDPRHSTTDDNPQPTPFHQENYPHLIAPPLYMGKIRMSVFSTNV